MAEHRESAGTQLAKQQASDNELHDKLKVMFADRIAKSEKWFARVVPAHVDADRFLELAKQHIKAGANPKLMVACVQNPDSLMVALIDCARFGLIIGETYHLVPFWDNKAGRFVVTGMRDYKGEIELIYRSGMVDAVFAYAVRGGPDAKQPDIFSWKPGMVFPDHIIADDGLADPEDRGHLRGAYAYARLSTGGYSPVMVMSKSQVLRTRPANAPAEFWGPDWPGEGKNTEAMWIKGPVHRLYNRVPHSADFLAEMQRASAAAYDASRELALPPPGVAAIEPPEASAEPVQAEVVPEGERRQSVRKQTAPKGNKTTAELKHALADLLADMKFGQPDGQSQRAAVAMLVRAAPDTAPRIVPLSEITHTGLRTAVAKLTQIRAEAVAAQRDPAADLRKLADAAMDRVKSDGGR